MSTAESGSLINVLEREHGEAPKAWFVSNLDDSLIVLPESSVGDFSDILSKSGSYEFTQLERAPTPEEIARIGHDGITVLEGNPETGNPISTRAVWTSRHGESQFGGMFESQRGYMPKFETLSGVVFPKTVRYEGSISSELVDPWVNALSANSTLFITKVLSLDEQRRMLERAIHIDRHKPVSIAVVGLGDIGSFVAQTLYVHGKESHIGEIILASRNEQTVEALRLEFEDIGLRKDDHPNVISAIGDRADEIFKADIILFIASGFIPLANSQSMNIDVRAVQYAANVKILNEMLERASRVSWDGLLLMASDPIEQLSMAALQGSLAYNRNNQRIAGFGAAINYGRARRQALEMNLDPEQVQIFGAHGKSVVAIPEWGEGYDPKNAEELSLRTGMRNYRVREQAKKPWRAPAAWMAKAIENLVQYNLTWASTFLPSDRHGDPGAFFGSQLSADFPLGVWNPGLSQQPSAGIVDALSREHRYIALTSLQPNLLFADPFEGKSRPEGATHVAFHQKLFEKWVKTAKKQSQRIERSDLALSAISLDLTTRIQQAIVSGSLPQEKRNKKKLLELIGTYLDRSRESVYEERTALVAHGTLGGELLAGISRSDVGKYARSLVEKIDIEHVVDFMCKVLSQRREPESSIIPMSHLEKRMPVPVELMGTEKRIYSLEDLRNHLGSVWKIEDFPLAALKHPHIVVRSVAWNELAEKIAQGIELNGILAKKLLSLMNFGDDFTLYQITDSESETTGFIRTLCESELSVLQQISRYKPLASEVSTDSIVLGTTGAPFGKHHVQAFHEGFRVFSQRYGSAMPEGYIALDDFSRSKAARMLEGSIPALPLRRRIALLQTVSDPAIHLINPAIPIWFDTVNMNLPGQLEREVSPRSKIWRLIGGDALKNYPRHPVYQSIPHIVLFRGNDRRESDELLNAMRFREYLQVDPGIASSSTMIREQLAEGEKPGDVNELALAFMRHYNIFGQKEVNLV